jgi:hypothetical protein
MPVSFDQIEAAFRDRALFRSPTMQDYEPPKSDYSSSETTIPKPIGFSSIGSMAPTPDITTSCGRKRVHSAHG